MSRLQTQGDLFREINTQKQDKSQWVDTRSETTYIGTYNFSFQYFNLLYLVEGQIYSMGTSYSQSYYPTSVSKARPARTDAKEIRDQSMY